MDEVEKLLVRGFQDLQRDLPEDALGWFEKATELAPDDPSIRLEIARCHFELAEQSAGCKVLAAIESGTPESGGSEPDDFEFVVELARLWIRAGDAERALRLFRAVPDKHELAPQAILESVMLLERTHRLDEARAELARHPMFPLRGRSRGRKSFLSAALAVAVLDEREENLDAAVSRLKRTLKEANPSSGLAIECGYRLARLLNKTDQPEEALRVVNRCKKIERQQMPVAVLEQHVRHRRASDLATLRELPADWFDSRPAVKDSKRIVVLGHPRSGTSLTARKLSGLTGANWIDECPAFSVLGRVFGRKKTVQDRAFAGYLQALDKNTVQEFEARYAEQMGQQFFGTVAASHASEGQRLIDKNPGLSNSLAALNRLLPGTAWVYVERDPRDVAMSCYFQRFGNTPLGWACLTPGGAMDAVMHSAELWNSVKGRLAPESAIVVRYELLVEDIENQIGSIADRLGWPESDGPETDGGANEPEIVQSPTYFEIQRAVDSRAVGQWRKHGAVFDVDKPAQVQILDSLGYHEN